MHFDFSRVHDIDSYIAIPEGSYVCRVAETREGLSRDGSPRWSVRLEVAQGEYTGRTAAWDSLTWSDRGIRRVKRVLEALGLDVRGELEVQPGDLIGRQARCMFQSEEREDAFTGRRVLRLRVPYAGYAPVDGPAPTRDFDEPGPDGAGPDRFPTDRSPMDRSPMDRSPMDEEELDL